MRETDQCTAIIMDGPRAGHRCKRAIRDRDMRMCNWHGTHYRAEQEAAAQATIANSWRFPEGAQTAAD